MTMVETNFTPSLRCVSISPTLETAYTYRMSRRICRLLYFRSVWARIETLNRRDPCSAHLKERRERKTSHPPARKMARLAAQDFYAAFSNHGSITILVTLSFLSRQTSYMAGASSRDIRCEMM